MQHTVLSDGWTVTATAGPVPAAIAGTLGAGLPAAVPGSVHVDLLDAGLIPDPYLDANEAAVRWLHDADWRYERRLVLDPAAPGERVDLVLDGVDTMGTIALGDRVLGSTANMHRSYRFDVRALADGTARALTVDLRSATAYADEVRAALGDRPSAYSPVPFNFVRKMACSFGWDWGPDLRTAGLWKPVRVERWSVARLARVRPLVTLDADGTGRVTVHVDVERTGLEDATALTVRAVVLGLTAEVTVPAGASTATLELAVPDAPVWWPVGHGDQPLADLDVTLLDAGPRAGASALDAWRRRIGFRSVEVDTADDEHGTRFTVVVNGRAVEVRGANWIPDDHLVTRITRERLDRRIDQAVGAHLNLLRVWGGGMYESEDFYAACDERGVLVWQDFLLACAAYPEEEPLRSEIEAEARENVVRLMPHPSLVVWNGGNENVWGHEDWGWKQLLGDATWGRWYAEELFPAVLAELDPTRPYATNSPFTPRRDPADVHPNDPDRGTHHQWDVWNRVDYTRYRSEIPRFCSEFGFQGPPAWRTLTESVHAADGRPLADAAVPQEDPVFLVHQKADDGNGKLDRGMAPHLGVPRDFADWHWATQLNQARAVRHAVEHYRSWWPRTAGWVVWQLNDCWPVTSWAAVDSAERPKPLWFALRAASAPRAVFLVERDGGLTLVATNDTDEPWTGSADVRRESLLGVVAAAGRLAVDVAPRSVVVLPLPADVATPGDPSGEVVVARFGAGPDARVATHAFVEDVASRLDPDAVRATAAREPGGYRVDVVARSYARDITLHVDRLAADARVDQALVTLPAGERATFHVTTDAVLDLADLVAAPVLRSANDLRGVPHVDAPPAAVAGLADSAPEPALEEAR